ncbi:hypothetical protein CXB51_003871 [Gossypium anomalum]|uniref:RNase H type-1 domain-containing protein n=1 Tax=Gossypium anomalum TaxID=47600 RepID=A0A8J5ZGU0_9ROSI|nr:hypothetical protein CXB51_003871 [Gossypium anomalum]
MDTLCIDGPVKQFSGECSVFDAKLSEILDGSTLILDSSLVEVMIQTDSLDAIKAILETSLTTLICLNQAYSPYFGECRTLGYSTHLSGA